MAILSMLPEELRELQSDIAHVKLQDFHLGRVLEKLATHLAHAHGLDPDATPEEETIDEEETVTTPVVKGEVK